MHERLTNKQKKVLEFITEKITGDGIPPTLREIRDEFGFSSLASPRHYLKVLAEKGYINLRNRVSRGIELLFSPPEGIPVLGQISAGNPFEAVEDAQGYLDLSKSFSRYKELFCLKVKGNSMEGAGILEGDLVIVKKQSGADPGQIVVALIDEEALVKRLKKKDKKFVLRAENPDYQDIDLKGSRIIGKVMGVFRNYGAIPVY
ncbi:transcriptional repressor LexA [Elusimicrobiota bacterium]